jgi:predicted permease
LPGVKSASLAYSVPMGSYSDALAVAAEDHPTPAGQQPPLIAFNAVSPSYFETMKIRQLEGRSFSDADNETSPRVAIVNQTMAERLWPHEDAVGKRFMIDAPKGTMWQVVGVAQNGKYEFLGEEPQPYFYLPLAQKFMSMRALEIRTSIAPESLMLPVQQLVKNLDPSLPIFSLRTMTDSLAGVNGFLLFRIGALLASCIGGMGLALAVVGVYGVVAFAASQRTREIGIRVALGASRRQVLELVLRQGVRMVISGAALGVLAAFAIARGVANLLVGVGASDPLTFAAATVFLVSIALCACYVPARRATKVDPMVALRYE